MSVESGDDIRVVFCTCPPDQATTLARALLERRLVACVNVIPGVRSFYWWDGEVAEDGESLMVIKTPHARLPELEALLQEIHPYDVPEIVALEASSVHSPYAAWIRANTTDVKTH